MAETQFEDPASLKSCRCTLPRFVRLNRTGLIDMVLACFGRYPWACRSCGARQYSQERGKRRTSPVGVDATHRSPYSARTETHQR